MPGTIKYLDLTLPSPEENLALDEALLDACNDGGAEALRFWESPRYFVVVGLGRSVGEDVDQKACAADNVAILRRCSGGGTVLQGPGCLNYALVLRQERDPGLRTVSDANRHIMERNRTALAAETGLEVRVEGHTDLAVDGLKFSGNSQRRRRHALLFHGTFLLGFDISKVEQFLRLPGLQPEYRRGRRHHEFLRNLELEPESVKAAIQRAWDGRSPLTGVPSKAIRTLVEAKYSRTDWNFRR